MTWPPPTVFSSSRHKVRPGQVTDPWEGGYFLISRNRWSGGLSGFLPDLRCRNIIYQISILCTGIRLDNEHSQGEAPTARGSLPFQSVSFLPTCQLLPLMHSIQGPLMTTERNAQCSCGPTWALQAGTLKPVVGSVFPEPVVGVVSGILSTCTPASWAFPLPPPPYLPSASEMQLLWPPERVVVGGAKRTGHLLVWSPQLSPA